MTNKKMSLTSITSGAIAAPVKTLVLGQPGVGKTSFAAGAPSPIFLPVEEGTNQLDVKRFPQPENLADVFEAIDELTASEHQYRTFVLDTVDALEPHIWASVCMATGEKSIEDVGGGFGKGYVVAIEKWRMLLSKLERLRKTKSMNIVLIAHTTVKKFQNPIGSDYDRFELKLAGKGAGALLSEWCDNVLFATYEVITSEERNTDRVRGVSTGRRIAHTNYSGAFSAKNRFSLPDPIELSWASYRDGMKAYLTSTKSPTPEKKEQ